MRILVVEDDQLLNKTLSYNLSAVGYSVDGAMSKAVAIRFLEKQDYDLIVLDVNLPDGNGFDICREVKERRPDTAVIFLTANDMESDMLKGFELGADDYVTKPFSSAELLARVRATLRNTRHSSEEGKLPGGKFTLEGLVIDYDGRQVFVDEKEVKLTQTEYNIVAFLSEHAGKMMTYTAIIKAIWGYPDEGSVKKLQVNMANIRRKLGIKPGEAKYIINELGVGYRMNS